MIRLHRTTAYRGIIAVSALALTAAGFACSQRSEESKAPLTTWTQATYWTDNNHQVPVCYVTPPELGGYDAGGNKQVQYGQKGLQAQQIHRFAMDRSWPAVAWIDMENLNVPTFVSCPTSGSNRYLRVALTTGCSGKSPTGLGPGPNHSVLAWPSDPYTDQNVSYVGTTGLGADGDGGYACTGGGNFTPGTTSFDLYAAHEMGHVLGWLHETDSPYNRDSDGAALLQPDGAPMWCGLVDTIDISVSSALTALDTHSIMIWSYSCPGQTNNYGLTPSDISGTRSIYGIRPESADSDHDGVSDLVDNCPYVYKRIRATRTGMRSSPSPFGTISAPV